MLYIIMYMYRENFSSFYIYLNFCFNTLRKYPVGIRIRKDPQYDATANRVCKKEDPFHVQRISAVFIYT